MVEANGNVEVKEEEEADGRTTVGKRLKAIEDTQEKILQTLAEHQKRIAVCEVRR